MFTEDEDEEEVFFASEPLESEPFEQAVSATAIVSTQVMAATERNVEENMCLGMGTHCSGEP